MGKPSQGRFASRNHRQGRGSAISSKAQAPNHQTHVFLPAISGHLRLICAGDQPEPPPQDLPLGKIHQPSKHSPFVIASPVAGRSNPARIPAGLPNSLPRGSAKGRCAPRHDTGSDLLGALAMTDAGQRRRATPSTQSSDARFPARDQRAPPSHLRRRSAGAAGMRSSPLGRSH